MLSSSPHISLLAPRQTARSGQSCPGKRILPQFNLTSGVLGGEEGLSVLSSSPVCSPCTELAHRGASLDHHTADQQQPCRSKKLFILQVEADKKRTTT